MITGKSVLVFDPGDSTGWLFKGFDIISNTYTLIGGTIYKDFGSVTELISTLKPDIVVMETFHLYAGAAKHLTHNEMYPCQVIGVIKHAVMLFRVPYFVQLSPSVKKYSGGLDARWSDFRKSNDEKTTEHTKDCYLHLKYFENHVTEKNLGRHKTPETM